MSANLAALLAFASAVLVAVLGHFLGVRRKRRDELVELKLKAFADFISCISRLVAARRIGEVSNEREELAALNDAKARICICADVPVVEALAEFWQRGGTLERESEIVAFTSLCMRMRESLGLSRGDLLRLNISDTFFKLEPSSFSFRNTLPTKPSALAEKQFAEPKEV